MKEPKITVSEIIKGLLFSVFLIVSGYFLNLVIKNGFFETVYFITSKVKSKPILAIVLVVFVLLGALVSVLSTSIEYGLPLHRFWQKKKKNSKNER